MRFNRAQLTREILVLDDEEALSARFTTAARRTLADAQALGNPTWPGPWSYRARVTYLAVFLQAQNQGMVFDGSALHASVPSPDGEESVRVKVISLPTGGYLALPPDTASPRG